MAADVRDTNLSRMWIKPSRCNPGKNCVEVGRSTTGVIIRDSKSRIALRELDNGPWSVFLAHCRAMR
jgi:hypothetical protein